MTHTGYANQFIKEFHWVVITFFTEVFTCDFLGVNILWSNLLFDNYYHLS